MVIGKSPHQGMVQIRVLSSDGIQLDLTMQKERQPDTSRQIYKQKLSGFFVVVVGWFVCFLSLHPPLG